MLVCDNLEMNFEVHESVKTTALHKFCQRKCHVVSELFHLLQILTPKQPLQKKPFGYTYPWCLANTTETKNAKLQHSPIITIYYNFKHHNIAKETLHINKCMYCRYIRI